MTAAQVPPVLPDAAARTLWVVGDVMLDIVVRGQAERLCPEAPVPVLRPTARRLIPGGAANVAANLAALGQRVRLAGVVGDDEPGRQLLQLLRQRGIDTEAVVTCAGRPTTCKQRLMAGSQQLLRLDEESRRPLSAADQARLQARLAPMLPPAGPLPDAVIFSDYGKGTLGPQLVAGQLAAARALGVPTLVDPKGLGWAHYAGAHVITPNRHELAAWCGLCTDDDAGLLAAVQAAAARLQVDSWVVTCGAAGMVVSEGAGPPVWVRQPPREVFDVTGAGDTVVAVLAWVLGRRPAPSLLAAASLANVAAGVVVGRGGTASIDRPALVQACAQRRPAGPRVEARRGGGTTEALPLAAVRALCRMTQQDGGRVVLTNGCFDLLHPGHVASLRAARALGELLVVALNSDASVRGLKGPQRPFVAAAQRAQVLAGLAAVDAVVIFDEPTPAALVAQLRPDVLVKGADWAGREVAGAAQLPAWGGRVAFVPTVAGLSSSALAERIGAARRGADSPWAMAQPTALG